MGGNRGKLIVISAPSGSGKTTIAKAIMKKYPMMLFSVSATTRAKRPGEVEGKDYFFLTKEEFTSRVERGELVEWEEIYGNYYGTLKSEVDRALSRGEVMLFDVDVKGALSIKKKYGSEAILIFIKPPSFEALKERLTNRKTEDEAALKRRLERVSMELQQADQFDFQVVNDDLSTAIDQVDKIIANHTSLVSIQHASS
ncbi:MAG TPA: guanylate kinase [Bacteroidota bacterium]|nr:guanylate kinase [Bacteroidota bacterium]